MSQRRRKRKWSANSIDVLNTQVQKEKLRRLAHQLVTQLRKRGNHWDGDNCKKESEPTNANGFLRHAHKGAMTLALQTLRPEETKEGALLARDSTNRAAQPDAAMIAADKAGATDGVDANVLDDVFPEQVWAATSCRALSLDAIAYQAWL